MSYVGVSILNVNVSVINYQMALSEVERWIIKKEKHYVCVAAAHLMAECQKDKRLLEGVNRAGLVTPDGMPLVWLARLYGYKQVSRVYGPTLMEKLCTLAKQQCWRVYLLGGASGQSQEVARALRRKFPALRIVGHRDTPARPIPSLQNQKIIAEVNHARPEIVFVGLGCPNQELWMIENRKKLGAPVLIGVGAAFDFLSCRVRQAPEWTQNVGFEWLYRLIQEPKRLWYRYTVINATFIWLVMKELLCKKRFSI
ncbi:WecB/TagA/CpsF family glycosyltransferase [Candidatus Gottesmanbacteria bacterium]|nr:WecB/TagA/CpsF family glycosyltransferase [Candidatus Gottesmanbacteria bacterium]